VRRPFDVGASAVDGGVSVGEEQLEVPTTV